MSISHCLFWKRRERVTAVYKGVSGMEVLKFKGEASAPYDEEYWKKWKDYAGYCHEDVADFCFIYDSPMKIPDEYMERQCGSAQSIWTVEQVRRAVRLIGVSERIDVCDEENRVILSYADSVIKGERVIMFSRNIIAEEFEAQPEAESELTQFIQYYVDKARGEE